MAGDKSSCASVLEQTMEHSIGVIDTLKKGCWFAQEDDGSDCPGP